MASFFLFHPTILLRSWASIFCDSVFLDGGKTDGAQELYGWMCTSSARMRVWLSPSRNSKRQSFRAVV